ncbi:MAG: DUF354 domain-containing protein [Desulfobacterales bacterium]
MKILIGIGHPADVHFFRFFIQAMQRRGHAVVVVAREKDHACFLLDQFGIPYHLISVHQKRLFKKVFGYFIRWARTYRLCRRVRPDIALGVGDFCLPQIGKLLGFQGIVITDTEPAVHDFLLTFPFASRILTPFCYQRNLSRKQIRYNSYNELAYLGDNRFSPDPGIYQDLGIDGGEKYVLLRFCSRTAVHDIGRKGISEKMKKAVVENFSRYARVFISSEPELPADLKAYQIPVSPEKIHHVIYYADLLYGESATMASEAACLGTPAIYVDDRGRGVYG